MSNDARIACVTGGTGMIGSRIAAGLRERGYAVRLLSRRDVVGSGFDHFQGGLEDQDALERFLKGAYALFHCAGELRDSARMAEVNVLGTQRLLRAAERASISFLCHMSSAGVVGATSSRLVDESSPCAPMNAYERTKWEAERLALAGLPGCRVVILRPTNVVDEKRPGAVAWPLTAGLSDRLRLLLKGGERAHLVHAADVAAAALHFLQVSVERPEAYFVSCDEDDRNTYAGVWAAAESIRRGRPLDATPCPLHLPIWAPYLLRRVLRGQANKGNVRYSSAKLKAAGFTPILGFEGMLRDIVENAAGQGGMA